MKKEKKKPFAGLFQSDLEDLFACDEEVSGETGAIAATCYLMLVHAALIHPDQVYVLPNVSLRDATKFLSKSCGIAEDIAERAVRLLLKVGWIVREGPIIQFPHMLMHGKLLHPSTLRKRRLAASAAKSETQKSQFTQKEAVSVPEMPASKPAPSIPKKQGQAEMSPKTMPNERKSAQAVPSSKPVLVSRAQKEGSSVDRAASTTSRQKPRPIRTKERMR